MSLTATITYPFVSSSSSTTSSTSHPTFSSTIKHEEDALPTVLLDSMMTSCLQDDTTAIGIPEYTIQYDQSPRQEQGWEEKYHLPEPLPFPPEKLPSIEQLPKLQQCFQTFLNEELHEIETSIPSTVYPYHPNYSSYQPMSTYNTTCHEEEEHEPSPSHVVDTSKTYYPPLQVTSYPYKFHMLHQTVTLQLLTSLKPKYWRNGRRNLQCFPTCKEFGDYTFIQPKDFKKHDFMWGKCRGSLQVKVIFNELPFTTKDFYVIARIHSITNPSLDFYTAVENEKLKGKLLTVNEINQMKETWILGEEILNQNELQYEFKPKVWKYVDQQMEIYQCGYKRRHTLYYIQMEGFIKISTDVDHKYFCIGSAFSSPFEIGSSRVLARRKRKANKEIE